VTLSASLFRRMLVEEFRLHTELFGSRRFAVFPIFTAFLVGAGVWLLDQTGTELDLVIAGLFVLILFVGFQVGTIGLVGRDAMRNVLGDMTLLVFSARTLPVSRRQLLSVFLVKDLVYYVVFFLTPVVVGFLPLVLGGGFTAGEVALLWVTIAATFALGAGASLTLAGVATRSVAAVVGVIAAIAAAIVLAPDAAVSLTPFALYADPGIETALSGSVLLVLALVSGPLVFEPPGTGGIRRVENDHYQRLHALGDGLTARPLLEVHRSSGSVWKVAFSLGVLFGVAALLLDRIVAAMNIQPSAGIAFGTLLGLGTFTTYNWVTQNDDPREYLRYPEAMEAVFAGKRRAFFVLSIPTGLIYLALAGVLYPGLELLVGVAVFPLLSVYVFGVTAYLTGLSPNKLLFDTALFAVYGAALMLAGVPLLIAALAFDEWQLASAGIAVGISALAAVVGVVLSQRTGPRWHERLRTE
jgi:hypothetical protein